jgi:hypothetical protein
MTLAGATATAVPHHNSRAVEQSVPAWFRWVAPSIADVIFIAIFLGLTYGPLQTRLLGDAGTGWHIRNGQHILQTQAVPREDYFSYTMSGQRWYSWEWLYDVAAGVTDWYLGLNGVVIFSALVIAEVFAALLRRTVARSGHLLSAALFLILSFMASSIHFLARPHLFTWVFVLVWWEILENTTSSSESNDQSLRRLLWLPVLMLIWVNVHGGFLVGLALIGLYLAGTLWDRWRAPDNATHAAETNRIRNLGIAGLLTLAATVVNPHGYKLWHHIYGYLTSSFYMNNIQEFLSPNFHHAAEKFFAAVLLLSFLVLALNRDKLRAAHLFVILFSVYAGLYAARNIPIACILLTLTVAPLLSDLVAKASAQLAPDASSLFSLRFLAKLDGLSSRLARTEFGLRGHILPVLFVAGTLWVCSHGGRLGDRPLLNAHFDEHRFPVKAVDYLATHGIQWQVFNPDYWGGYLIYRLAPGYQVFTDDRHDFYGEDFVKDYIKVKDVQPGWESVLDRWHVNWVLIRPESTLANALKELPKWRVVYDDGVAIIFARRS